MANQPHRWEWLAWSDRILENNGTTAELDERVDELWKELQP
jgi:dephospho-CoA kinase